MAEKETTFEERNVPYQFYLPVALKQRGVRKADAEGVQIAPFMKMAWEQFCERPIEESMRLLKAHKKRHTNKAKGVTLNK